MLGQVLSHYQILEKLGEGGMGVVYRALDTRLHRPVAIKVLPREAMADPARNRRFVQEARSASALNHPNIITVYDVDVADGVGFIAMEYVAGSTLDHLIGGKGLKLEETLKYAAQIADALAAAHAAGLVHRDLKPGNVMVTEKGLVKVLDFGLAKLVEAGEAGRPGEPGRADATAAVTVEAAPRTEEGTILGTVAYMSPEQADGQKVDARSDIFAFGSLLYEMLTGRRAFQGATSVSTLAAILHTEPRPAGELAGAVPSELDSIIRRCLQKDPSRRFQHLDDVKTLLEGLSVESAQTVGVARRDGPARARPMFTPAVAVIALLVAAVGGVGWWLVHDRLRGPATASNEGMIAGAAPAGTPAPSRLSSGGPASANLEANRYFENAMQLKVVNDLSKCRQMLERALELDPHFAEARAWHGFTNWLMLDQGYSNDSALLNKAEEEMRSAAGDDPTLARAHAGFAWVYLTQGRKELVPAEVEQALKSNPGDEDALSALQAYHVLDGDDEAANRVGQQILDRIPLFFPARMNIGDVLRTRGDLAGAIREQEKILEQDAQNVYALVYLARTYMDAGDVPKARRTLDRVQAGDRQSYLTRRTRAILLALEGRRADALKEMDAEVVKWAALVAYQTSETADFFAVVGDTSKALDWLDQAVRLGDERAEWFRRDPLLVSIRPNPRFQQILQSIEYRRQQRNAPR